MARRIIGIDFSGAANAGRHIWLTEGEVQDDRLAIVRCEPALSLAGSGRSLETCLPALVAHIGDRGQAVIGCDFPFGLPRHLVAFDDWPTWLLDLPRRYATPEMFKDGCLKDTLAATAGLRKETRRQTDGETGTPWSAWNLKLYKQAYHGMTGILLPLVRAGAVSVLPMQPPKEDRPWLIEVCPASYLRRLGLYRKLSGESSYKKNGKARRWLIAKLMYDGVLAVMPTAIELAILRDARGDAIDSLLAALATFGAQQDVTFPVPRDDFDRIEGRVYA